MLGPTKLFVLPSTSPANAAVTWEERLRWFARTARSRVLSELRFARAARAIVLAEPEIASRPLRVPVPHQPARSPPMGLVNPSSDS